MSAADFRESRIEVSSQPLEPTTARRAPVSVGVLLALMITVVVAAACWLSGNEAAAATARSDQVILYQNRDFSGPVKTWSLEPDQPFLAVPYTGDDFRPASASIKLGADVGVLLFEHPFFSTIDETCDYQLGDATDPDLWWRSDKAMFVPGPQERGPVEGNLRAQAVASLILYRRASGPPPGALLLERRRYVNWDCSAPTKARGYKRLFVPVAAAPHRQGCFNLDAGLSYGSSGTVALDFSAASELLLIAPRDLDADYAEIDHRVTASLHIARDCAGTAVAFSQSESGGRRFDLKQFDLDRKARSVMLRYEGGAYDAMLPAAGQEPEATGVAVAETSLEDDPDEPPQEPQADVPEEPRDEASEQDPAETAEEDQVGTSQVAQAAVLTTIAAEPASEASAEPISEPTPEAATEATVQPDARSGQAEALAMADPTGGSKSDVAPDAAPEATPDPTTATALDVPDSGAADAPDPASTGDLAPAGETMTQAQAPAAEAQAAEAPAAQATETEIPDAGARDATAPEGMSAEAGLARVEESEVETPQVQIAQSETVQSETVQPDTTQSETVQSVTPQSETTQSDTSGFLVLPEAEEKAVSVGETFTLPLLQGYRLNFCLYQQDEGCGQEAATKWCEALGFGGGASSFEVDENIGSLFPTLALGDLQLCANFVCDGFKEITCLP
jgi:hypothetical protein